MIIQGQLRGSGAKLRLSESDNPVTTFGDEDGYLGRSFFDGLLGILGTRFGVLREWEVGKPEGAN
jgi:hypothetical protein